MSFVGSAWTLTIFFILLSALCFYLSYTTPKTKKRMIEAKEILFLAGLAYLLLAHFAMFVSIGQSLDENYEAPCEWLVNQTQDIYQYGDNYTAYHWDYISPEIEDCPNEDNLTDIDCVKLFHQNTTYSYYDSCATRDTPASATALVVVFTWLLFALFFSIMMAVIYQLTRFTRDFF